MRLSFDRAEAEADRGASWSEAAIARKAEADRRAAVAAAANATALQKRQEPSQPARVRRSDYPISACRTARARSNRSKRARESRRLPGPVQRGARPGTP